MESILIRDALLVNEGQIFESDVLVKHGRIFKLGKQLRDITDHKISAPGCYLLPGVIDDQVHFREPGLTHKGEILTEARAAVAGGTTTYMEMPNTNPQTLTQALLEEKYAIAAQRSIANYSFYMGASNDNLAHVLRTDASQVCGVKVFMGSSTGNMLVDSPDALERIFSETPMLIATHCEQEEVVRRNLEEYKGRYGNQLGIEHHPLIRSHEACLLSSQTAIALAQKYGTRLHILHISTAEETGLFTNAVPLSEKRITSEACIHHLWFSDADYGSKGNFIKWNPAVKTAQDREAIWAALLDDRIDVVATDHAPHTLAEKSLDYLQAPSGGPLVQHSLLAMLDFWQQGRITLPRVVEKMSHAPAICFRIADRGFIREDYWADLVLIDPKRPHQVTREGLLYKCGWSPFEGHTFPATVTHTIVSGRLAYREGQFSDAVKGMRLNFHVQ
jgi:dihydroorotase